MSVPNWMQRILQHYGTPYEVHHHTPVYSASQRAHAEHVTGYRVAKCVWLSASGRPVLVVLPACAQVDLASVQAVAGGELRVASESEIRDWFPNKTAGALPPLRLRLDQSILMDRGLAHLGKIVFSAGSLEDSITMRFRDWYRMVRPGVGHFALPTRPPAAATSVRTILVVDDEADTHLMLRQMLEKAGFACQVAPDGTHALALASQVRPSAILLDLMLPDMSGFDVYERLRRTGPLKSPPVLVLTALDTEENRALGKKYGADAYLTKPVYAEALVAELNGVLADAQP